MNCNFFIGKIRIFALKGRVYRIFLKEIKGEFKSFFMEKLFHHTRETLNFQKLREQICSININAKLKNDNHSNNFITEVSYLLRDHFRHTQFVEKNWFHFKRKLMLLCQQEMFASHTKTDIDQTKLKTSETVKLLYIKYNARMQLLKKN